jgi:hypothetical protein
MLAIANPVVWLAAWRGAVRIMSLLAPVLAIGRVARSVVRSTVESEFSAWFQPLEAVRSASRGS